MTHPPVTTVFGRMHKRYQDNWFVPWKSKFSHKERACIYDDSLILYKIQIADKVISSASK